MELNKQKLLQIALLGLSNSGKSSFVNSIIGQKISISSRKKNTTSKIIKAVLTEEENQIVFYDLPGFGFKSKDNFSSQFLFEAIYSTELQVLIIDGYLFHKNLQTDFFQKQYDLLQKNCKDFFIIINKIDLLNHAELLAIANYLKEYQVKEDIFYISTKQNKYKDDLKNFLFSKAIDSAWLFGEDEISDINDKLFFADITYEQILNFTHKEIPYRLHVETISFKEDESKMVIYQDILVNSPNHKKIMIGKNGQMIKNISLNARKEIEKQYQKPTSLFVNVRIAKENKDNNAKF